MTLNNQQQKLIFLTNYPIEINDIRIIIEKIILEKNILNLEISINAPIQFQLIIQVDEIIIDNSIIIRPEKLNVTQKFSQVNTISLPIELIIDITNSDNPKIGYIKVYGIQHTGSSITISKIKIYSKILYIIEKIKLIENYRNLYNAEKAVEYTIINKMDIPIRYIVLTSLLLNIIGVSAKYSNKKKKGDDKRQDLSIYYVTNLTGLQVTDEKGNRLNYLTFYELNNALGSNLIKDHSDIIVDLGNRLKPEERKTIILSKQINVDSESYIVLVPLRNGIVTEVLIRPPQGYFITVNGKENFIVLLNTEPIKFITLEGEVTNLRIDDMSLTIITDHKVENGQISSTSGVNFKFICNCNEDLRYSIAILHNLKVRHEIFWEYLFQFLSMITYGLLFQELGVNIKSLVLKSTLSPLMFWLFFIIGNGIGGIVFILIIIYKRSKSVGAFMPEILEFPNLIYSILLLMAVISIEYIILLHSSANIKSISRLNGIANVYLEMEFAILVILELPTILIEREIGDLYGKYLLSLIIITTLSMLLLIPWIV